MELIGKLIELSYDDYVHIVKFMQNNPDEQKIILPYNL